MRTDTTLRALRILAEHSESTTARDFAWHMWPDSKSWAKPAKTVRHGAEKGAVMNTAGACFLGRLIARGLVAQHARGYSLTASGWDFLSREGKPRGPDPRSVDSMISPVVPFVPPPFEYPASPWTRWNGRVLEWWNGYAYVPVWRG